MSTLSELYPLDRTPEAAIRQLDPQGLSPLAKVIRDAILTGKKPTPDGGGFYVINVVRGGKGQLLEYVYHDKMVGGKRERNRMGRLYDGAQELADACNGHDGYFFVDTDKLAWVLKPTSYRKRVFVAKDAQRRRILRALETYKDENGGVSPTFRDIATMTGLHLSTVRSHVRSMEKDGLLVRNGRRTLRVAEKTE